MALTQLPQARNRPCDKCGRCLLGAVDRPGRSGGLRAIGDDDDDFKTGFSSHTWDAFKSSAARGNLPGSERRQIKRGCIACHDKRRSPELLLSGGTTALPNSLAVMPAADVAADAIKWRENQPNWGALRMHLVK